MHQRLTPIEAAHQFVDREFPDALGVILAGSFLRGEDTPTSDLDLVLFVDRDEAPFRASYRAFGWPIETFVQTRKSYRRFFGEDLKERRPALPTMCAEGIILRDSDGIATRVKEEARAELDRGPRKLTVAESEDRRYAVTDLLEDFIGCTSRQEGPFIAVLLAQGATELVLLHHQQWIGAGKWTMRALRRHDSSLAERLAQALAAYITDGEKSPLIRFTRDALALEGGPVFEGYYRQGPRDKGQET